MRRSIPLLILLFLPALVFGQTKLSYTEFLEKVKTRHPVAIQAEFLKNLGRDQIRSAKGALDPRLQGIHDNKFFDGKNYYSNTQGQLLIPTWPGIDFKAGFEIAEGYFVNEQNITPAGGLMLAGVKVPIGQGLLIDERRAAIRIAFLMSQMNEVERQRILNELYLQSTAAYLQWELAFKNKEVLIEAVQLAQERFEAVKQMHLVGEKPAVDTLEAMIQLQSRQMDLAQWDVEWRNKSLMLSTFIWNEELKVEEIDTSYRPEIDNNPLPEGFLGLEIKDSLHPLIAPYFIKTEILDWDRRFKADKLKPKINLNYNFITEPLPGEILPPFTLDNYKWGLQLDIPLFLRKERGDLGIAKFKLETARLDLELKRIEVRNKIREAVNQAIFFSEQRELARDNRDNYQKLLEAERQKFFIGESSLFMVNAREIKTIEASIKVNELQIKYMLALAKARVLNGRGF